MPLDALVVLDSAPIIYFLEDHPKYRRRFEPLRVDDAPHPAFGHPLPASGARGNTQGFVALLPARGEKVPEGRMRGVNRQIQR